MGFIRLWPSIVWQPLASLEPICQDKSLDDTRTIANFKNPFAPEPKSEKALNPERPKP